MKVTVAENAGFCMGVKRAVDTAIRAAEQAKTAGVPCCSLGELIHNPDVVERLSALGVKVIAAPEEAPQGAYVILRSHGVSPALTAACQGRTVIDCTCPYVKHLHDIVDEHSRDGSPVILIGDAGHPENIGTAGWCHGECYVVATPEDVAALPALQSALVVAQTTFPTEDYQHLLALLNERIPRVQAQCTICSATEQRQNRARALAAEVDCMVVVGGRNSANTRKLYEACKALCPNTCMVERAADLPPHLMDTHNQHIGIAAGASTPDWSLKEVVTHMNDMELNQAQEEIRPETAPAAQEPEKELTEEEKNRKSFLADVDATMVRIHTGQTVTGTVVQMSDDEVCVNIGYKSDGVIKRSDLVTQDVQLGDEIEVEVVKVNDGEGNVLLSQRNIVNRKAWDALMAKYEAGEYVDAVGKEAVKGGLIAVVDGIRAFVPASQLAQRYVEKISQFVGQDMRLKIIEVDPQKKRIVASRKEVIAAEAAAKKAAAWEKIEEGAIITGIVRRFADFGAFVDLGGVDGLIHITDMAWSRISHPSEVLQINQQVEVKVLSADRERERIQLGYKQLQPKPWDNIEEKYPVDTVLERPVVRIRPFGAFIELEPGVDGLVHISQVALTRVAKVEDVLQVGQMVRVKVLGVDPEAKRISLSIRQVLEDEAFNYEDAIPGDDEAFAEADEAPAEAEQQEASPQTDAPVEE